MAKKKEEPTPVPPQFVIRVNPEQRECLLKIAEIEDRSISDTIKLACKLLAEKHGVTWPKSRA